MADRAGPRFLRPHRHCRRSAIGSQQRPAAALLCAPAKTLNLDPISCSLEDYKSSVAFWNTLLGQKARRIYPIPPECLAWNTERGPMSRQTSSESDLMLGLEAALEGAPWWDELRADAVEQAEGDKDEARMLVYDTAFPDDIPDEWSAAERAKSHGPGVQQTSAERFWRNMLGPEPSSLLFWLPGPSPGPLDFTPVKRRNFIVVE